MRWLASSTTCRHLLKSGAFSSTFLPLLVLLHFLHPVSSYPSLSMLSVSSPSHAQTDHLPRRSSRAFREDKQNRFLLETPVEGSVIEDRRMKDSWAARAAKEVLEEWRHQGKGVAVGGVPKSVIDRARRKVEVLTF